MIGTGLHQAGHLGVDADIGHHTQRLAPLRADLVDHRVDRGAVTVSVDHHLRTLGRQRQRDRAQRICCK